LLGIATTLATTAPCDAWLFPVYTVNKSETGFELTYQCLSLWLLQSLSDDGATEFTIRLRTADTPVARADAEPP